MVDDECCWCTCLHRSLHNHIPELLIVCLACSRKGECMPAHLDHSLSLSLSRSFVRSSRACSLAGHHSTNNGLAVAILSSSLCRSPLSFSSGNQLRRLLRLFFLLVLFSIAFLLLLFVRNSREKRTLGRGGNAAQLSKEDVERSIEYPFQMLDDLCACVCRVRVEMKVIKMCTPCTMMTTSDLFSALFRFNYQHDIVSADRDRWTSSHHSSLRIRNDHRRVFAFNSSRKQWRNEWMNE